MNTMLNPVTIQYMSREELERLLYSMSANRENPEALMYEAVARRLLALLEKASDR
jgi:hypothetical protein